MKHDSFKLWEFFRLSFKPGVWAEVNTKGARNDIEQLLIDWKRKQYQKAGR